MLTHCRGLEHWNWRLYKVRGLFLGLKAPPTLGISYIQRKHVWLFLSSEYKSLVKVWILSWAWTSGPLAKVVQETYCVLLKRYSGTTRLQKKWQNDRYNTLTISNFRKPHLKDIFIPALLHNAEVGACGFHLWISVCTTSSHDPCLSNSCI